MGVSKAAVHSCGLVACIYTVYIHIHTIYIYIYLYAYMVYTGRSTSRSVAGGSAKKVHKGQELFCSDGKYIRAVPSVKEKKMGGESQTRIHKFHVSSKFRNGSMMCLRIGRFFVSIKFARV